PLKGYTLGFLRRWPLGTAYTDIVADLKALTADPRLKDAVLCVDETGVGKAVVEMVRKAGLPCRVTPLLITAGHETTAAGGGYHVPKKELVSVLQVLLQSGRLAWPAKLPMASVLARELAAFKVKVTTAGHETFEAWR